MNTVIVPAMLAAMVGAWLPTQLTEVASTLTDVSCQLQSARFDASTENMPAPCKTVSMHAEQLADPAAKPQTLAWLSQWQSMADL
jgi:hypothetical protein